MSNFHLLKSESVPLTFELAREFKDMTPSPAERPLSDRRMKYLQERAENNLLVNFNWITAELDGKTYRCNGNHSSNMLFQLNGKFPEGLYVHRDHYGVEDVNGLVALFRQIDDRRSSRGPGDVAGAFQGLSPELNDVSRPIAKVGVEAISWWARHVEGVSAVVGDDQYELLGDERCFNFLRWLDDTLSMKTPELRSVPCIAAMYASFDKNEVEARTFWHDVARGGIDFKEAAPATTLDLWLKGLKEITDTKKKPKPGAVYQGCVYAWNAFRNETEIPGIRSDVKKGLSAVSA